MFVGTLFEKYQQQVKILSRQEFCISFKGFYLLGVVAQNSPTGEMDFVTGVIHLDQLSDGKYNANRAKRSAAKPGNFLVRLEKKEGKTWPEWISVGRANNNDVVVRHPSVSKLHARLEIKKPPKENPEKEAGFWLTDLNSSNGTTVNGKPLDNAVRYPVQQGDSIRIGDVDAVIVDAGRLYDILISDSV